LGPSIKVKVNFDHLKELRQRLDRHEINQALADVGEEVADMWYEDAHEITGFMKSRIQAVPGVGGVGGQGGGLHLSVICDADYARMEVERGGSHDFTARGTSVGQKLLTDRMRELVKG
jgi:hypothetical protein